MSSPQKNIYMMQFVFKYISFYIHINKLPCQILLMKNRIKGHTTPAKTVEFESMSFKCRCRTQVVMG